MGRRSRTTGDAIRQTLESQEPEAMSERELVDGANGRADLLLSNNLVGLAETAVGLRLEYRDASSREKIILALQVGRLLISARSRSARGEWRTFLEHAGIPDREAHRFMQLARSWVQPDTVASLGGIRATLRAIGKFRLPESGQATVVSGTRSCGLVWNAAEPGSFNISAESSRAWPVMCQSVPEQLVFAKLWDLVPPNQHPLVFFQTPVQPCLKRLLSYGRGITVHVSPTRGTIH